MDLSKYIRRKSSEVQIGECRIGGNNPVAVQSMTNTATADTPSSVDFNLHLASEAQSPGTKPVGSALTPSRECQN